MHQFVEKALHPFPDGTNQESEMKTQQQIKVGIAGACARGGSFRAGCEAVGLDIRAVCDINRQGLADAAKALGAGETYTDYQTMLEQSDIDAVIIGTPMQLHVPQSIAALQRGIHVLCEVTAGVSVEECKELVLACEKSEAVYMMAENYTYMRQNVLVRELVRQELFGEIYYAEGEYIHELKKMNEDTKWRRKWQTGIPGVTYCTHSLGPILQWMPGDRVVKVSCADTAYRYKDPREDEYANTTPVMLCKTAKGALIKIRVDMISDRPHSMTNYSLQGSDGCYESSRGGPTERDKIWLRGLSEDVRWHDAAALAEIDDLAKKYLPEIWRNPPEAAKKAGHGGGDYFEILDFVKAIRGEAPTPIGIHEAMDMTLPGLISQQSVEQNGRWIDVPDSRTWKDDRKETQLLLVLPKDKLDTPPIPDLPDGYMLRQYAPEDEKKYLELTRKAGFDWGAERFYRLFPQIIPGGIFVIEHKATGDLVATSFCKHRPIEGRAFGGELGWLAGDPDHSGKGLGMAVCSAVIARFIQAGYKNIYVRTQDWRLAALKIYLKLGYQPYIDSDEMAEVWRNIFKELNWKSGMEAAPALDGSEGTSHVHTP